MSGVSILREVSGIPDLDSPGSRGVPVPGQQLGVGGGQFKDLLGSKLKKGMGLQLNFLAKQMT